MSSPLCDRRRFIAAVAGVIGSKVVAAPFVPARDPQVVAFAPSGSLVATGVSGLSDGSFPPRPHPDVRKCGVVAVWDVASRKRVYRWETFGDFTRLAFSPDGKLLAACRLFTADNGVELDEVRVWDVTTGRLVQVLDRCHAFDFSPDGQRLAVLSRSRCAVYSVDEWNKQAPVVELGSALTIAHSADGRSLIGIVPENGKYRLRRVVVDGGEGGRTDGLPLAEPFYSIGVAADGAFLATGHSDGNVLLWNAASLDLVARLQAGTRGLAHSFFSPDAALIVAGCQESGDVVMWSVASKQEAYRYTFEKGGFKTHLLRSARDVVRPERDPGRFCFSPNGEAFLVGCYGGILRSTHSGSELARFGE